MKKINIFIASSIIEFATERMAIENFIRNVSDKFEECYKVKLQPLLCENFDDAYTKMRKQEEYNEKIRNSEFCFFIFFTKVGEYTREEFDVAREQFEKSGKPKIYTYFKTVENNDVEKGVRDFMGELDKVFGHYYSIFSHIDTVKLRILLCLKLQEMDFVELKVEDGKCVVDGHAVMPVDNVSEFANNEYLVQLRKELENIEEEYYTLRAEYDKNEGDTEFYKKYSAVASRRQTLIDEIGELQGLIFNVSLRMVQDDVCGEISAKQKKAYALFEKGDYEGCMAVLNSEDIDNEFLRERKKLKEQELTVCRKYIKEHKTAIDILETMKKYDGRFTEVEERYEKILPVIFEMNIELDTAYAYTSYLINQNKEETALPIAERLLEQYKNDEDKAKILNQLGIICYNLNKPEKAEGFYLKAIDTKRKMLSNEVNPERICIDLTLFYRNTGDFYAKQNQEKKAEDCFLKAVKIAEILDADTPNKHATILAGCYNDAGNFYENLKQLKKAEEHLLKAYDILNNVSAPSSFLAELCQNIGILYSGQPTIASTFFIRAIEINEKLVKENPNLFNPYLSYSYYNIGCFYKKYALFADAEKFFLKAIETIEKTSMNTPDESLILKTIKQYSNMVSFYYFRKQINKANIYCLKAIELTENLFQYNPDRYSPNLADTYNDSAGFYLETKQIEKANKYYIKAFELMELIASKSPDKFSNNLAETCRNLGIFYYNTNYYEKAEQYFLKAIKLFENLVQINPGKFIPYLADAYFVYAISYFIDNDTYQQEATDKAFELAKKQPDHPLCKQIIEALQ